MSAVDRLKLHLRLIVHWVKSLGNFIFAPALFKRRESIRGQPAQPQPLPPSAATGPSSLVDSTPPPDWRHDVFVSFRGEDTRKGFASHLFHALKQADIRCYRDIERQERGQVVGPMLIKAIRDSRIAIIIFSTNYADSKWCLKELVEILVYNKLYKEHGHTVIPIFYDVEPSEVRRQSGRFGEGFKRCQARDEKEKEAWRAALEEAGNISSWHLDSDARDEAEFIELIVQDLSNRIFYSRSPYFIKNAVGLDQKVDYLISLLDIESDDVRMIGVCGMEGIGKTAIARAICSRLYNKFQGVSLLEDIQHADDEKKLVRLQKQLLQNILKIRHVTSLSNQRNNNIGEIRTRLYQKKMLLILDNLDKKELVYSITGDHDFLSPGSRILITTRNEQLLNELGVQMKFMVPGLNREDSLQLFCNYAFAQGNPREGYEELSNRLVHYAGGVPLAIQTFASFLSGKTKEEWYQILKKLVKIPRLDSIGVYLRSVSPLYHFKPVGPYGGSGSIYDHDTHSSVRKITVIFEKIIQSITVEYDLEGSLVRSSAHGRFYDRNGGKSFTFALDYPNEFLISISGYIAENYRFRAIRSLKFQSNKRMYGPFGKESGTPFSFPSIDNGRIVGFFGHCNADSVTSIGAYFGPAPRPYQVNYLGHVDWEGETWDDKTHKDIRQIDVVSSSIIESISVIYDNYGHPLGPFTHGRFAGGEKHTIKLDYPYEYLTSISGYIGEVSGKVRVRSLSFQSNQRMYGPFGPEVGIRVPAQWNGGKIVGFFGAVEDSHLRCIKAHLEPVSHIHPFEDAGPFGGDHGYQWDDGKSNDIKRIVIAWGRVINSFKCVHEIDGIITEGTRYGGRGGSNESTIELDYPNEYISMMSGCYGKYDGEVVVTSLTFHSNIRAYGPFGGEVGFSETYFRTPLNIGMINGFYGRSGDFLNAIGAHFAPVYHKLPLKLIGPFGHDSSDDIWDDGRHSSIRQINITYGWILDSIKFTYDDDGDTVEGSNHGGNGGRPFAIMLDYPNEHVRSISGHVGPFEDYMCIRSLTLRTSKRSFGPFGIEEGTPFSIEANNCKLVGFFGCSSIYLHSIGAHIETLSSHQHSY